MGLFEKLPPLTHLVGTTFGGCSLVLRCNPTVGTPEIVGVVSRTFEGVRVWDVKENDRELNPLFKIVYANLTEIFDKRQPAGEQ